MKTTKEEAMQELNDSIERLEGLEELSDYDMEEMTLEMLDDTYGQVEVCGNYFDAGRALQELDPMAFRCAVSDYIDAFHKNRVVNFRITVHPYIRRKY